MDSPNVDTKLKIGIVDSGCSIDQKSDVAEYINFATKDYGYAFSDPSYYDTAGHGRFVCQIIIDGTDDVAIYSAKVANGRGDVTYQGLFSAVKYLVEEKDVNIINLSLGGQPYISEKLITAFQSYTNDVLFIAAVGNKGNDFKYPEGEIDWPASLPAVIGVGAFDQNNIRSDYSSFGRTSSGIFATEFAASGQVKDISGTSFSAPRVTARMANIWQELVTKGIKPTPELVGYYAAISTGTSQFNAETGWGLPQSTGLNITPGIRIMGTAESDPYIRFIDEQWTRYWKIYATSDTINLDFTGNATELIQSSQITDYAWGKILEVDFDASLTGDNYFLNISQATANSISYQFNVSVNPPTYKILLDHRNTVNGFANEYGQYARFDKAMRDRGIQVDQIQIGSADLNNYDAVLVTEFGYEVDLDVKYGRAFNQTLFDQYLDYTRSGGKLQIMASYPEFMKNGDYTNALQNLGIIVENKRIPSNHNEISYTSNFTQSVLFDGVIDIGASGSGLAPVNSSQSVLLWYESLGSGLGETTSYHGVAIQTSLDGNPIIVWSGSAMMQNEYYINHLDNFDQFLLNFLQLN